MKTFTNRVDSDRDRHFETGRKKNRHVTLPLELSKLQTLPMLFLDGGGQHFIELLTHTNGARQLLLNRRAADRRSPLHDALKRNLAVEIDGRDFAFVSELDLIDVPDGAEFFSVFLGGSKTLTLARGEFRGFQFERRYVLSPFETRFLAQNGYPHPVEVSLEASPGLTTDLHTHFAGCIAPEDLLRVGAENDVPYPRGLLREIGMRIEGEGNLALSDLSPTALKVLEERMAVPLDRQVTFFDMERMYRLRAPVTKNIRAFPSLLRRIAADYRTMGVKYVELSLSNVLEAQFLRLIHAELPEIERESGVTIRFLAAFSRHADLEWDLDCIDRLKQLAPSRYLVGVDFMGHERNSTRDFARQITDIAEWAHRARPGFVVRVHAGENPAHPENVRVALECVEGKNLSPRIGHGLYGVDDETLARLRDCGAVVEFNLNSNFALNNIQSAAQVPVVGYVGAGVPAVLGTDGYGIYRTTLELEARTSLLCGLKPDDLETIRRLEADYVANRQRWDESTTLPVDRFDVPDDAPNRHYSEHVMARTREAKQRRDDLLDARLKSLDIPLLDARGLNGLLAGKLVVSFAGAWKRSWETISTANRERVRDEIEKLLTALDPTETVLVTGGTTHGVEGVVHRHARPLGFAILGTLVKETPPAALEPDSITHACLIGERLHDKAAGLYKLMKDFNGWCLFIGGGNIVSDEIQAARNLKLRFLLMDGPEGASTVHARVQPDRAFTRAEEVLNRMANDPAEAVKPSPYWHVGPNPTVDIVLTRTNPRTGDLEVLLIRRDDDSPAEPGKWALPGGFQGTDAPRGSVWTPGVESPRAACVRELLEETSLDLRRFEAELLFVGEYEGPGRDPRDTDQAWSKSTVFTFHLPHDLATLPIAGSDDASDAQWIPVEPFPSNLAFDHDRILRDGLEILKKRESG